jgi:hypothetical protein
MKSIPLSENMTWQAISYELNMHENTSEEGIYGVQWLWRR